MKRILILVNSREEEVRMRRLVKQAGIDVDNFVHISVLGLAAGSPMKEIRLTKPKLDAAVSDWDCLLAAGETPARLAFDKPIVNITKSRGRDFEYVPGTRKETRGRKKA